MRDYFEARHPTLLAEGFDVQSARHSLRDAPDAALIIERFLRLAHARTRSDVRG
jgi:hypothetical protein